MNAQTETALHWAASETERVAAARFFARIIAADAVYISHGEIQQGLSPDGETWAADLEARLIAEFAHETSESALALASCGDEIVGAAAITWSLDAPTPFATLADLAVASARRGSGLGAALVSFIEAEARRRGALWVFLESGLRNHRAHHFFAAHGFREVSHVFAKRITPQP